MQGGSYRQIALPPLDRRDMTALLDELLGSDRTVAQFAQDVAERAQLRGVLLARLAGAARRTVVLGEVVEYGVG